MIETDIETPTPPDAEDADGDDGDDEIWQTCCNCAVEFGMTSLASEPVAVAHQRGLVVRGR